MPERADGTPRTLPFVRFEDNEAHAQLYGINLGESVRGVGPDERHPLVLKNTRLWNTFWAFRPGSPSVLVDGMDIFHGRYGLYRPAFDRHAYSELAIAQVESPQAFATGETPRGLDVPGPQPAKPPAARAREIAKGAAVRPVNLAVFTMNPLTTLPGLPVVKAASASFPAPLDPVDDLPPATVITSVSKGADRKLVVRGTTSDNGTVKRVRVNRQDARALRPNFAEWVVTLTNRATVVALSAFAEDKAGNVERLPHEVKAGWR